MEIDYIIRKSRRTRGVHISVHHDGTVVVTKPNFLPDFILTRIVHRKMDWIRQKLDFFKKFQYIPKPKKLSRKEYSELKLKARELVLERISYFNQFYNFKYKNIYIKNQRTRWGSCSKAGNVNFNYRIALLPFDLADYIIVHELCHLGELNHSRDFWNLVGRTIPNHKELRSALKKIKVS